MVKLVFKWPVAEFLNRVLRSEMIYFMLCKLSSSAMSQGIVLLFVLYLDSAEFGSLGILLSLSQLFIAFLVAWHSGTILNHGQKYFARSKSLYTVIFFRLCCIMLATICITISLLLGVEEWINNFTGLKNGSYVVFLWVVAESVFELTDKILVVYGKLVINEIMVLIVKSICFFYMVFSFQSIESYFEVYLVLHLIFSVFVVLALVFLDKPKLIEVDLNKWPELFRFSIFAAITSFSVVMANQGYNFVLRHESVDLADIGAHGLAYKAFMSLSILTYFVRVLYPKILYSQSRKQKLSFVRRAYQIYLPYFILLSLIGYVVICLLVNILIIYSFGSGYENTLFFMVLYLPAFLIFQRAQFLGVMLNNSRHYKKENLAYVVMSLFLVSANILLARFLGVYGVILGTTLAFLLFNLLLKRFLSVRYYLSIRDWG